MPRPWAPQRLWLYLAAALLLAPLLSGCLITAGESVKTGSLPTGGTEHRVSFYRTDTNGALVEEHIDVTDRPALFSVMVSARVTRGSLRLVMLNGNNETVAFELEATSEGVFEEAVVQTNDVGDLRYRIEALNAFDGEYAITWSPPPTPTPVPTATPTPEPTPTLWTDLPTSEATPTP